MCCCRCLCFWSKKTDAKIVAKNEPKPSTSSARNPTKQTTNVSTKKISKKEATHSKQAKKNRSKSVSKKAREKSAKPCGGGLLGEMTAIAGDTPPTDPAKRDVKRSTTVKAVKAMKTVKNQPTDDASPTALKPNDGPDQFDGADYPLGEEGDLPEIFENVATTNTCRERLRSMSRPPSVAHQQFIDWLMEDSEKAGGEKNANPISCNPEDGGITTDAGAIAPTGITSVRHFLDAARRFIRRRTLDDEATLHGVELCLPEADYDSVRTATKSSSKILSTSSGDDGALPSRNDGRTSAAITPLSVTPVQPSITHFADAEMERTNNQFQKVQQQAYAFANGPLMAADSTTTSMAHTTKKHR